ncbi:MAG: hypothetical protein HY094_00930 [Candidatus Melainabacteria bacterium]|nr:hypothetical protein [Candidatus Melainabacteria bacterium]
MINIENNISKRRELYRRRRNFIRKIFFILFVLCFLAFVNCGYKLVKNAEVKIEVIHNRLIKRQYVSDFVQGEIGKSNFFLVSPRKIAQTLLTATPILRDVIIRKYLFPQYKYLVVVNEKNIWGTFRTHNDVIGSRMYVTDDGSIVSHSYLELSALPDNITSIIFEGSAFPSQRQMQILKEVCNQIKDFNLLIDNFSIDKNYDLDIYTTDRYLIHAGKIDQSLTEKIKKIKYLLNVIKQHSFKVQYLDLNLEAGAVLKTYPAEEKPKMKKGLFGKLMLN